MFDNEKRNLKIIEDFIQNQLYLFNLENMKHLQSYGYSGLELDFENKEIQDILYNDENYEKMLQQEDFQEEFSDVIRKAFFVTAYHRFEYHLHYHCQDIEMRFSLQSYKLYFLLKSESLNTGDGFRKR